MTITVNAKGEPTSFNGENAVDLFRIRVLSSGLGLLSKGISPTRGFTLSKALLMATQYTGKKYKRTQVEQAREDLKKIEHSRLQHIDVIDESKAGIGDGE